jgi:hypothetical protein
VKLGNTVDSNKEFYTNRLFDMEEFYSDVWLCLNPPTTLINLGVSVKMEAVPRDSKRVEMALVWPEGTPLSELGNIDPSTIPIPRGYELDDFSFERVEYFYENKTWGSWFMNELTIVVRKEGTPASSHPPALIARPTMSSVLLNGESVALNAYNINGNNYFKLRDIAYVLNGTQKQFEVLWNAAENKIQLISKSSYTSVGEEMTPRGTGNTIPKLTSSSVYLDGKQIFLTAYKIGANNYFKLRDIGQALNFGVDWDAAINAILISTDK